MLNILNRVAKASILRFARSAGGFHLAFSSKWRNDRLLILGYHGISINDEHEWNPGLFLSPQRFAERLRLLRQTGCNVLRLEDALRHMREGTLPKRSVSITFDDGFENLHSRALPLLQAFGFPATLYAMTLYTDLHYPVFPLVLSYMAWQKRGTRSRGWRKEGLPHILDLSTRSARSACVMAVQEYASRARLNLMEQDRIASEMAQYIGVDYDQIRESRMLQMMTFQEMQEAARAGIDVQMHTHTHDFPDDQSALVDDLSINKSRIETCTSKRPRHFCYPSGIHFLKGVEWLRHFGVESGVTCARGLASVQDNPLLLPRYLDGNGRSAVEFEAWLSGFADLLSPAQLCSSFHSGRVLSAGDGARGFLAAK